MINNQKFSLSNLNAIITPIKIDNEVYINKEKKFKKLRLNSSQMFKRSIKKRKALLQSDKSLKDLMKYSTILNDDENKQIYNNNNNWYIGNKKNFFQYAFLAHFSDIRNIEVEPGIIKFTPNEIEKNDNNNKIKNDKITPKNPDVRKKIKNNIYNKNKPLNKIIENDNKACNRHFNRFQTIKKIESKNVIKSVKERPVHQDSLSTKNILNIFKRNIRGKHSKSIYIKKKKKITFKKNLNSERYKTVEEIFEEIKNEKNNFNYDSINHINNEIIKNYKKMNIEMKKFKNSSTIFREYKKKSFNFPRFLTPRNKNHNKNYFKSIFL